MRVRLDKDAFDSLEVWSLGTNLLGSCYTHCNTTWYLLTINTKYAVLPRVKLTPKYHFQMFLSTNKQKEMKLSDSVLALHALKQIH